jgi:hypothetical protein
MPPSSVLETGGPLPHGVVRNLSTTIKIIFSVGNLSLISVSEFDIFCVIKMTYFLCQLLLTDTKDPSIFSVNCYNATDIKNLFMVSAVLA